MEAQLTDTDLKNLMEAVEAWEASAAMGKGMSDLLTAVLIPDEVRKSQEFKDKEAAVAKEHNDKVSVRKETTTLLKAKLILMRQAMAIERLEKGT